MSNELVHFECDDRNVVTITLDSPHNRNALSTQLVTELDARIDAAIAGDARAIVLTHLGPAFCAGADLKERAQAQPSSAGATSGASAMVAVMRKLMDAPCPTIAALNGAVRAGGIGLMASCDLVVVDEAVTFALTEVRIGVAPAMISVPILRRVSPAKIAAAMLTGEPFSAIDARQMGLISHVAHNADGVDGVDGVEATVGALVDGVLAGAPGAVAATKALLTTVPSLERDDAFERMRELSEALFAGPEAAEGMAAFAEKRPPQWQPVR